MKQVIGFIRNNKDLCIVMLIMFGLFFYIMYFAVSDLPEHARIAKTQLENGALVRNNFLMYFLANLLSAFSGNRNGIKLALVFLIAMSNTAKYAIVKDEFSKMCTIRYSKIASLALLFVYIVPVLFFLNWFGVLEHGDTFYLGYYVPNVWHNSTVLCMMPFAILTYFLSVRQMESYDKKRNYLIALYVALGTMVKPSFFFIYAVAYPILLFTRYRFSKEFFYSLIPIVVGLLCVMYQFLTIYDGGDGSGVVVSVLPLFTVEFWQSHWSCLLSSLALPIIFVLLYRKTVFNDREFWFSFVMLVVSLGICWCCQEIGPRASHGNFNWQVVAAMWFVYYYMLKTVIKSIFDNNCGKQSLPCGMLTLTNKVFLGLYGIHVLVGGFYLGRYLITGCYF